MRSLHITAINFADGRRIDLPQSSIVVFVGPNNSGKSAALKAIRAALKKPDDLPRSAVKSVEMKKLVDVGQLEQKLVGIRQGETYLTADGAFSTQHLGHYWTQPGIGFVTGAITTTLTTEQRLGDCLPCPNIDLVNSAPSHPFQWMYADRNLENMTSNAVRKAFNVDLIIDRGAGGQIPAYIGDRPKLKKGEERADPSYCMRVRALAPLHEQGDGLRSFVSIVARAVTEEREILLIDEPEAFLHPPQARLVARNLSERNMDRQTFIATHSSDILQGLLSNQQDAAPVTVVRLTRTNDRATAISLDPNKVADLWQDPILRFSDILDGIFHHGVVVTESDGDCRFYQALVEVIAPLPRPDLHYCYSGGKDRLHIVIRALAGVGMPVATIVDFDVLNSEATLRRIIEAAGGVWPIFEADWITVKSAVETRSNFLGAKEYVQAINDQLKLCKPKEAVPREVLSRVKKLSREASPWDFCKRVGLSALKGPSYVAAVRLLDNLSMIGIFVLPVGEMEGFARSIEPKGVGWVEEIMKRDLAKDGELATAREFAEKLSKFFNNPPCGK